MERALVSQAWLSAHGRLVDVVVGVPATGMSSNKGNAHAWLDGNEPESAAYYVELLRIPAAS